MRLKTFQAPSMAEAMRQVKKELGDEAIIVNSREEKSGWVKITAAIDSATEEELRGKKTIQPDFLASPPSSQKSNIVIPQAYDDDDIQELITDTMLRHRVPASLTDKIISTASTIPGDDPLQVFTDTLHKVFDFRKAPAADKRRKMILAGPPGAGKTLMTAKLTTKYVMDGHSPTVITTDITRAGGIEQLSAFLKILEVPLHTAKTVAELKNHISATDGQQVIIDTGGLNPFDPHEMKFLSTLIKSDDFESALVLAAGTDAEEAAEIAQAFALLGVKQIIPTRLDFARYYGGILNAADKAGLYFSESSHTPQVADGILYLNPKVLANLLIPNSKKKVI